ncbi:MAG: DUF4386 domain-containing protein [Burkholderiales bacterium]|nr:DUF4386 domain-containing protein [Burkholderiales bacterium]
MSPRSSFMAAGWILFFLVASNVPFALLAANFGYDDVLREPAAVVLTRFHEGGESLVFTWLAFALSAAAFMPVVMALESSIRPARQPGGLSLAAWFGLTSALIQMIALLRWVFVVPVLAAQIASPDTTAAGREAAVMAFQVQHQFAGVLLGEFVGQCLLVCWTVGISRSMLAHGNVARGLGIAGLLTVPLWLLGFTELLHTVMPAIPSVEAAPIAFSLWGLWLLMLAIYLFAAGVRGLRAAAAASPAGA